MSQDAFPSPFDWLRDTLNQMESFGNDYGRDFLRKPETMQAVQGALTAGLTLEKARVDAMAKLLAAVEMPSRSEVEALSERLRRVEESLARIEAHLGAGSTEQTGKPKPTRNRKPPSKP